MDLIQKQVPSTIYEIIKEYTNTYILLYDNEIVCSYIESDIMLTMCLDKNNSSIMWEKDMDTEQIHINNILQYVQYYRHYYVYIFLKKIVCFINAKTNKEIAVSMSKGYILTDYGQIPIIHDDIIMYIKANQLSNGVFTTPYSIITIPNSKQIKYSSAIYNDSPSKIISNTDEIIIIPNNTYKYLIQ